MSNLISAEQLSRCLNEPSLRVIDSRFMINDPPVGRDLYERDHIPNAIYFDLDKDLSSSPQKHGGRHPLPEPGGLAKTLGDRGIGNQHQVVIYDDHSGVFAGRAWWLFKYLGHDQVQVLDGGYSAWLQAGFSVEDTLPEFNAEHFEVALRPEMKVDIDYIERNLENPEVLLVDARGEQRYRGDFEPMDKKAGHIPGAINLPYAHNLEAGYYKPASKLKTRFEDLEDAEEIIVYCGSGVSANHVIIALEEAGIQGAKLYPGSWSDWSSYPDKPVVKEPESA